MALNLKWTRDPSVAYPNIWTTFTAAGPNTNELREYVIKELTEDRYEEAFDLYVQVYIRNEPMAMALGMINDKDSIEWFKKIAFSSVKQHMGLACFDAVNDKVVGVNLLYVISKCDKFIDQIRALPLPSILSTWYDTIFKRNEGVDLFTKFQVEHFLGSVAMAVHPEYTRRGICQQLLLARFPIGKTFDLKLSVSGFSSKYAVHTAQKLGFQFEKKISYKELAKLDPRFDPYNSLPDEQEWNTLQSLALA